MSESTTCLSARRTFEQIRSLKQDFDTAYDLAVSSGTQDEIERAQGLKLRLETNIKALQETLATLEAERLFDLRRQYEAQTALLRKARLIETKIETLASGAKREVSFMTGFDGEEYVMPSYEAIALRLAERKEFLPTKADQGFNKLLLVPFGMSLDVLLVKLKTYLLEYKRAYDKAHENDTPPGVFALDENLPIWVSENEYSRADVKGTLVYDPKFFNNDHDGVTKEQITQEQKADQDTAVGWRILLLQRGENGKGFKNIPKNGNGQMDGITHPRQDIEAGKSPNEYLADLQILSKDSYSPYSNEFGMTPEEWVMMFMTHLEETGKPIDDFKNSTDSSAYLIGTYLITSGEVPRAYWDRGNWDFGGRRVLMCAEVSGVVYRNSGVRSSVRV